jgi:biopolymer transport protein ExbD
VLAMDVTSCPVMEPPETEGLPGSCRVRINDERVAVTDLADRVAEIFATREGPDRVLFLAANERLNYEGVMRIVDVAKSRVEGLRIGLVTEK